MIEFNVETGPGGLRFDFIELKKANYMQKPPK